MTIRYDEPLAKYSRFATGGPADIFFEPENEADLLDFLSRHRETPITILGLGSNVLIRDSGIRGAVIRLSRPHFREIKIEGETIRANAGAASAMVAARALERSIAGFGFLSLIPGTIGGAIPTNAGCFGQDMAGVLKSVEILDPKTLGKKTLSREDLSLSYRASALPADAIILGAAMKGAPGDKAAIKSFTEECRAKKYATQPVAEKTAGSTFRNPPAPTPPAYKLIRDVGLQGVEIDGAKFSDLHANFLINTGAATSASLEAMINLAREKVAAATGVELQTEVRILGEK